MFMKYLLPILFAFCFFSCQRHSDNWEKICDIENYIESHPDSALIVLDVKGKVDFPQIGFEKRTTERGFSKVSKSV